MFDFDEKSEARCPIHFWIGQLLLAPAVILFVGGFVCRIFELVLALNSDDRGASLFLSYLLYPIVGFTVGCATQTAIPRSYRCGGRAVWLLPSAILIWAVLDQLARNPAGVIRDYVWPPPGNEGFGLVLGTWPTIASSFYSAGIYMAGRRWGISGGETDRRNQSA